MPLIGVRVDYGGKSLKKKDGSESILRAVQRDLIIQLLALDQSNIIQNYIFFFYILIGNKR